jgi:hypothetical protein
MASSFIAEPQAQARAESGIAAAERLRGATRAIAYGSAVNAIPFNVFINRGSC